MPEDLIICISGVDIKPKNSVKLSGITLDTEAATRGVLLKRVFLEISQNSQEDTCVRESFSIKLQMVYYFRRQ